MLLYSSRCYSWLYIGCGKQQVAKGNQSKSCLSVISPEHFSQYPYTTQQCYTLDESDNNFDICTPCGCFKLLPRSLNGSVPDAPTTTGYNDSMAPAAHIFWTSLEEILILFNLLFLLNCSYPTIFWNCCIYNLATFLTAIDNHQMWPSDFKFFVSYLLIFSD